MEIVYCVIFVIAFLAVIFIFRSLSKSKPKQSVSQGETQTKHETKEKKMEMVEIEDFNSHKYVNDVFDSAFYSIQNDEWGIKYTYNEIEFTKSNNNGRRNEVCLKFSYSFERPDGDYRSARTFTIKSITCTSGYETFRYDDKPTDDVLKFIYGLYSKWKNDQNEADKKKADKSLESIRSVLGKSSERGAKLDELLGN